MADQDLTQQVAALSQQLQQLQADFGARPSSLLKAPKPSIFTGGKGSPDVEQWLRDLHKYLTFAGETSEARAINYSATLLREAAGTWWQLQEQRAATDETILVKTNWVAFADALRRQFKPISAREVARARLAALRQTGSVSTYTGQFNELTLELNLSTDEAKWRYYEGLHVTIRQELLQRDLMEGSIIDIMAFAERRDGYRPTGPADGAVPMDLNVVRGNPRQHQALQRPQQRPHGNFPQRQQNYAPNTRAIGQLRINGDCYNCGRFGHMSRDCRQPRTSRRPPPRAAITDIGPADNALEWRQHNTPPRAELNEWHPHRAALLDVEPPEPINDQAR
jgi:hypothetical protein